MNTIEYFIQEISKSEYNTISKDEEKKLILLMRQGDLVAREKIIKSYLRYILYCIKGLKIPKYVDIMDIIQEGIIGLIIGIEKFDFEKYDNLRLGTYCTYWIKFFIFSYIKKYYKDNKFYDHEVEINKCSFYEDNISMEDTNNEYTDDNFDLILNFDDILFNEFKQDMLYYIENLEPRFRAILKMYFGLQPYKKNYNLKEIGAVLNLSAERVRQIKDTAIQKLRENILNK